MEPRDIYITEFDLARLKELVNVGISFKERDRDYLESLHNELDRAHVVEPTAIPRDVVTMNSQVRIEDMDTGDQNVYTLVFPSNARIAEKKVSILAPIGTAMLGCRVGDTVDRPVPAGNRKVRIKEIPQPGEGATTCEWDKSLLPMAETGVMTDEISDCLRCRRHPVGRDHGRHRMVLRERLDGAEYRRSDRNSPGPHGARPDSGGNAGSFESGQRCGNRVG